MFVLHPSSRCDVCLEAFSWETEMAPYAIACGHVFCRPCLESVVPPKCPLCRKNYDPSRLKKLHVDRPDDAEDDPKEAEFLQRIALAFDAPEEQLRELVGEVDGWLSGKNGESCLPVRKARLALDKFQELRYIGIESKREISRLKQDLTDLNNELLVDREQAIEVQNHLLKQKDELGIQLESHKSELDQLRTEIHRRALKNPLPPPPQPVSFARYPAFDPRFVPQTTTSGSGGGGGGVSFVHPRNFWPDDERENYQGAGYRIGGTGTGKRDRKLSIPISNPVPVRPGTAAAILGTSLSSNAVPQSHPLTHTLTHPRTQTHGNPQTSHAHPQIPAQSSAGHTPRPKPGIIPGASSLSKFMPPDPEVEKERGMYAYKTPSSSPGPAVVGLAGAGTRTLGSGDGTSNGTTTATTADTTGPTRTSPYDPARDGMDPYTLTAVLLPEYLNGFSEGFSAGSVGQNAVASGSGTHHQHPEASGSGSGSTPSTEQEERREHRSRGEREREGRKVKDRERERERREREKHRAEVNGKREFGERERERDREEGRDRDRDRERRGPKPHRSTIQRPTTTDSLPSAIASLSAGPSRSVRRDDEGLRSGVRGGTRDESTRNGAGDEPNRRPHRRRTTDPSDRRLAHRTHAQAQATLASILSDNPSRAAARRGPSRLATAHGSTGGGGGSSHGLEGSQGPGLAHPTPRAPPVIPPASLTSAQTSSTPSVPTSTSTTTAGPTADPPSEQLLHTPASRHSIQSAASASTASSWGTVSSGPRPEDQTPNSFMSLNLRTFARYQGWGGAQMGRGSPPPQQQQQQAGQMQETRQTENGNGSGSGSDDEYDEAEEEGDEETVVEHDPPPQPPQQQRMSSRSTRPGGGMPGQGRTPRPPTSAPAGITATAVAGGGGNGAGNGGNGSGGATGGGNVQGQVYGSRHTQAVVVPAVQQFQGATGGYAVQGRDGGRSGGRGQRGSGSGQGHGRTQSQNPIQAQGQSHSQPQNQKQEQGQQPSPGKSAPADLPRVRGHAHSSSHPSVHFPGARTAYAHTVVVNANGRNPVPNGIGNGNNGNASVNVNADPRTRRLSGTIPVPSTASSSLSSLSLHSLHAAPPPPVPHSAPVTWGTANGGRPVDDDDSEDDDSEDESEDEDDDEDLDDSSDDDDEGEEGIGLGLIVNGAGLGAGGRSGSSTLFPNPTHTHTGNALGLAIPPPSQSPAAGSSLNGIPISAPAPRLPSHQAFLRSFSYESYAG